MYKHKLRLMLLLLCLRGSATSFADSQNDYNQTCAACHNLGVAGAPSIGDRDAWSNRVTKDKEVLYRNAIKGFSGNHGVMPPKGGFTNLSDDQVKAIVDYMIGVAK
ncbi:MAG: c-type cytochrome [Arenicellales bacterium]